MKLFCTVSPPYYVSAKFKTSIHWFHWISPILYCPFHISSIQFGKGNDKRNESKIRLINKINNLNIIVWAILQSLRLCMCGNRWTLLKIKFTHLHGGANKQAKKNRGLDFAREYRHSCRLSLYSSSGVFTNVLMVHSDSPTASAVDSFTYTDTHLQASYHRIPTHRYISVIYYVTSAKICDSWHNHPLHRLWYQHTQTLLLLWIHVLESVNSHPNSHDAHQKCQMTSCFCVFLMALLTKEGMVILDVMLKSNSL